jgi:hypothetical protein
MQEIARELGLLSRNNNDRKAMEELTVKLCEYYVQKTL